MSKVSLEAARKYARQDQYQGNDIDAFLAGVKWQRERDVVSILSLFYALKEIKGKPSLRDLIKLAKRIKNDK